MNTERKKSNTLTPRLDRINLNVPFVEKDEAKKLGAKWDPDNKTWYISKKSNLKLFAKWLPKVLDEWEPNIVANYYYIAESIKTCWKCKRETPVHTFFITKYEINDEKWEEQVIPTFISNIVKINKEALNTIQVYNNGYFQDFTKTSQTKYYMNHCKYCKAKQGDFNLHNEPNIAFMPVNEEGLKKMKFYPVKERLEVEGGYSWNSFITSLEINH